MQIQHSDYVSTKIFFVKSWNLKKKVFLFTLNSHSFMFWLLLSVLSLKGAGNIEYGDIENGEIKKMGTSKKWGHRKWNNGNIERKTTAISKLKSKTGKSKMWLGTHFSIIPQYRFVRNLIKYLNTRYHHNTSLPVCWELQKCLVAGLLGTTKNASLTVV